MKQNKGSEKRFFNNKNKIKKKKERKGEKKKNATPLSSSCLLPFCVFVTSLGVCVFLEKFRTRQTGEKFERTGSKKREKERSGIPALDRRQQNKPKRNKKEKTQKQCRGCVACEARCERVGMDTTTRKFRSRERGESGTIEEKQCSA